MASPIRTKISIFGYPGMISTSLRAKEELRKSDLILRAVIDSVDFPEYSNTHDVFEDLCSCILDMRIHYAGSNAAFRYKRLKKLIRGASISLEFVLGKDPDYWGPLKLSRQKTESLELWAEYWLEHEPDSLDWAAMSDEEVYGLLGPIKGVSLWTVQMILLFTLERPDELPVNDYQLKKAVCEVYGYEEDKNLPKRIEAIGEK